MDFEVNFDVKQPSVEANFDLNPMTVDATFQLDAQIDVDSELSETSKNPVQNKVITQAIKGIEDKHFTFDQSIASNVWIINHNLNKKPSVTVVDSAESVVIPDEVKYNDLNSCTIYFLASFTGKAYLN